MATNVWVGGAPVVPQVATITIAGTWAAGDTVTITANGNALVLTVGTAVTTADIATEIKNVLNGLTLGAAYSSNFTGLDCGEFGELEATAASNVVSVTEKDINGDAGDAQEGRPFTISVLETTAGDGTATLNLTATTATGPHHFTNAANWSLGSVPGDNDTIIFHGPVSCRYGIDQSAVIDTATIRVLASFTGELGLPRFRTVTVGALAFTYEDYLPTYFKANIGGALTVYIGEGEGDGPGLVKIDPQSSPAGVTVYMTGDPLTEGEPVVQLLGSGANTIAVYGGTAAMAFWPDETATFDIDVAAPTTEAIVTAGIGVTISGARSAGANATVTLRGNVAAGGKLWVLDGGTLNFKCTTADTAADIRVYGGTINFAECNNFSFDELYVGQGSAGQFGVVDFTGFMNDGIIADFQMLSAGSTLRIPAYASVVFTTNIVLGVGVTPADVTIEVPATEQYIIQTTTLPA